MSTYLLLAGVVVLFNVLPAFAPPTWSVLVFFTLRYHLDPVLLIAIAVVSATTGRYLLAHGFRKARPLLPNGWVTNMENAGSHLYKSNGHAFALLVLFFFSPLSSAQLFEAAGVIKSIRLGHLAIAFAAGRIVTYTTYVSGAHALSETSIGEIVSANLTSPEAITIQILMVLALVALGNIKWRPHIHSEQS